RAAVPDVLAPPRSRRTKLLDAFHDVRARRGALPAIAGGLALLLTCGLLFSDDGEDRVLDDEVASVAAEGAEPPDPTPAATPVTTPDTTAKPPARADAKPPQPPPAVPAPVGDEPPLPPTLAQPLATLLDGEEKRARKRAAEAVLEHKPKEAVPAYALNLAWLEKASSCGNKRGVLEKMEIAADPRVLPALKRLAHTRRKGCGFFGSQDCLDCLRETLARTIGRLEAEASAAAILAP
ncbi:MAG TPA: hypothetical protein VGB85_12160, partial [Nannocystis sp.]